MKVNLGNNRPFIPYRGVVSIVGVYGPTDNLVPIGNVLNKGLTIRANQALVKRHLPRNQPTYPNRYRTGEEHDGRA